MNHPVAAEGVLREKLSTYVDPYLEQSLGDAKAIEGKLRALGMGPVFVVDDRGRPVR